VKLVRGISVSSCCCMECMWVFVQIEVYFPELGGKGRVLILYRVENVHSRGSNVLLDFENF